MWTMEERIWIKIVYLLLLHNSKTLITSLYKIPASSSVESHSVLRTVTLNGEQTILSRVLFAKSYFAPVHARPLTNVQFRFHRRAKIRMIIRRIVCLERAGKKEEIKKRREKESRGRDKRIAVSVPVPLFSGVRMEVLAMRRGISFLRGEGVFSPRTQGWL